MEKAPIIISKAALLSRINSRAGIRAVDARFVSRSVDDCALVIYYDNGEAREFKGLEAA